MLGKKMAEAFSVSYKIQDYKANLIIFWAILCYDLGTLFICTCKGEGVYCKKETMSRYKILLITFKTTHGQSADYLKPLVEMYQLTVTNLRSASCSLLCPQKAKTHENYAYLPTLPVFPGISKFFIKSPDLPVSAPNLPDKMDFWAFLCFSLKFSPFFHKIRTFFIHCTVSGTFLHMFSQWQRLVRHYNDESAFWSHVRHVRHYIMS